MTDWALYEKLLAEKEERAETMLFEAEKQYKQAKANYEAAKRDRYMWNQGIEERLKGMEHIGETKNTAQSDYASRNIIS